MFEEILLYHNSDFKKEYNNRIKMNLSVINHIFQQNKESAETESDDEIDLV